MFSSIISTKSFWRERKYSCCFAYSPIRSSKILNLYFGQNTMWYLHSYSVCDNFLNRLLIMYFPFLQAPSREVHYTINVTVEPFYGTTARGSSLYRLINIILITYILGCLKGGFIHVE